MEYIALGCHRRHPYAAVEDEQGHHPVGGETSDRPHVVSCALDSEISGDGEALGDLARVEPARFQKHSRNT